MKRAFTLIELLVVIAIIGILSGVILATFGGSTESARAAKCISNLKSLSTAANAYAMESGWYPLAGSVEVIKISGTKLTYREKPGWISWLSCDGQYGRTTAGESVAEGDGTNSSVQYPQSHQSCDNCPYYGTGDVNRDRYALANGSVWRSCGKNPSVYVCPAHELACGKTPLFSYVMNAKFGYDVSRGTKPLGVGVDNIGTKYGTLSRADRTLLFADIHMTDAGASKGEGGKGGGPEADAVLNYKADVDGKKYGKAWQGTPEQIGFPHKGPRGRKVAHVVFADGHTEKLIEGTDGSLTLEQLTAVLCEGKDFAFTGKGYEYVDDER